MRGCRTTLPTAIMVIASPPVPAQDAGGVFDLGQMTGTLPQDHINQSERKRA